ncbi:hypothetical protein BOTBODRAFT_59348 [Botryobasidium botryosum FD-172 SS1]|uniref:Uncharacterized protein n=1 Tax=Botryobasidium botryosum (strain FD-172 SS1) TaxID=930990 RepID=A0A067LYK8_BOTB1|nr:hypothetical protein BOTBODRAFT_59348 [Botryobasidium botryosum FD-172 SS1]
MHFVKSLVTITLITAATLASPVPAEAPAVEKRTTCWYQSGTGSPIFYVCPGACGLFGGCK